MQSRKIVHDRLKCIGCNSCVFIAPQNWKMDKEKGKSHLINSKKRKNLHIGEIFECDIESNQHAAEACPTNAIKVEKSNG